MKMKSALPSYPLPSNSLIWQRNQTICDTAPQEIVDYFYANEGDMKMRSSLPSNPLLSSSLTSKANKTI